MIVCKEQFHKASGGMQSARFLCQDLSAQPLRASVNFPSLLQGLLVKLRQNCRAKPKAHRHRAGIEFFPRQTEQKAGHKQRCCRKRKSVSSQVEKTSRTRGKCDAKSDERSKTQDTTPGQNLNEHGMGDSQAWVVLGPVNSGS